MWLIILLKNQPTFLPLVTDKNQESDTSSEAVEQNWDGTGVARFLAADRFNCILVSFCSFYVRRVAKSENGDHDEH